MIYLLGYPKSGNTWIKYICITLLGIEFENIHTQYEWPGVFLMSHAEKPDETYDLSGLLITPLRDYKECVISYRAGFGIDKLIRAIAGGPNSGKMSYMGPLKIYDEWPEDRRLMVYYEDLISDKLEVKTIEHIAYFLTEHLRLSAISDNRDSLIEHRDIHKARCLNQYNSQGRESVTDGETIHHHKNVLAPHQQKQWDETVKKSIPELYDKYLTRYTV